MIKLMFVTSLKLKYLSVFYLKKILTMKYKRANIVRCMMTHLNVIF